MIYIQIIISKSCQTRYNVPLKGIVYSSGGQKMAVQVDVRKIEST